MDKNETVSLCRAIAECVDFELEFRCPICNELLMFAKGGRWMRHTVYDARYHRLAVHLANVHHTKEEIENAAMAALIGGQGG